LADRFLEADGNVPSRVVGAHFGEVGDVADVVADAVFVNELGNLRLAREFFRDPEGFEDRAGVGAAAADVVNLGLRNR